MEQKGCDIYLFYRFVSARREMRRIVCDEG